MVAHGRVELLAHPLSQKYLQMKWNSYGKYFHLANLLFYCIFLAFVTIFSAQLMDDNSMNSTPTKDVNSTHNESHDVASQEVLMLYTISFSSNTVPIEV
jgi:transient receptor potential cation channel subfamily A protein 1